MRAAAMALRLGITVLATPDGPPMSPIVLDELDSRAIRLIAAMGPAQPLPLEGLGSVDTGAHALTELRSVRGEATV